MKIPVDISSDSIVDRVYEQLKAMAISYEFKPGERLNEGELAKRLGVSRAPLREALNRLNTEGFLRFTPGKGFFCRELDAHEIFDLYELRESIEIASIRLAIRRARDEDIDALLAFLHATGPDPGERSSVELFGRTGIVATFFVPAFEAARAPDTVRTIAAAGHEIAAHGNAMEDHSQLGDAEAGLLASAHEKLSEIAGVTPRGWRAPGGTMSANTLRHLAGLGYAYDSSFQDDDLPYSLKADGGGTMVELPQNEMLIDATLWNVRQTHERVLKTWIEEFEGLYNESCYACLTLHPRSDFGSGRASRIAVVEAFLRHVRSRPEITILTCGKLASQFGTS